MQFLSKLSEGCVFSFIIIITASNFAALSQTVQPAALQANIINIDAKPVVFVPGVVSTPDDEFAPSFTPDGNTVYFSNGSSEIYFSKLIHSKWAKPKVADFSGRWKDMDPFISPDGKRLFFSSYRPLNGEPQNKPQTNAQIWYVDRLSDDNWSTPHHLDAPVNLEGIDSYAPSMSSSGTLYFFSPRRDINNKGKSYYAKWMGNHYDEPKLLSLNGANSVRDPFIAPDERYLIFVSGNDLYISYRNGDGWSAGQKLGPQVNNGDGSSSPYVSPDGKMLYYSQNHAPGILMIPVNIPKVFIKKPYKTS
jgi:Tol biopolymer transport system component